jgi:hypothetical protein
MYSDNIPVILYAIKPFSRNFQYLSVLISLFFTIFSTITPLPFGFIGKKFPITSIFIGQIVKKRRFQSHSRNSPKNSPFSTPSADITK